MPTCNSSRSPSFAETFGQVWRWMIGRQRPVPRREAIREQRLVEEIAKQLHSVDINPEDSNPSPTVHASGRRLKA